MNVVDHVAKACQLCTSTVANIRREGKTGGLFKTAQKQFTTDRKQLMTFDRQAIRRVVRGFYERQEYPTLQSLLRELKAKELYKGTLHKLLREMGFRYRKHENRC